MTPIVTRIPPSPTGFMHIGTARTALYNWLYARGRRGRFLLRIEDTDAAREVPGAVEAILDGLRWLGLDWDGEPTFQSRNLARHAAVARELLEAGKAYRCTCTAQELAAMGHGYDRRCRDAGHGPDCGPHTIRIDAQAIARRSQYRSARISGDGPSNILKLKDEVQGDVCVDVKQLDDFVLLRADGSPTYMLSVVVDDHDAGITHVIRGDDHLNNAFRQRVIYEAMGWAVPVYAHIPLIHGPDGKKLSKRHGALGVEWYRDAGYLPEALCNYLLRLGWGHGDDEIISRDQALAWFDLAAVGRSPARFDVDKLSSLNAHYIQEAKDTRLLELLGVGDARFSEALPLLKPRAKTLVDLREEGAFLLHPVEPDDKAQEILAAASEILPAIIAMCADADPFDTDTLKAAAKALAKSRGVTMGAVGMPLRATLTGRGASADIFALAAILGRKTCLARLRAASAYVALATARGVA